MTTPAHPYSDATVAFILEQMVAAARGAERVIREGAQRLASIEWQSKGPADYLSEIDTRAESEIRDFLELNLSDEADGPGDAGEVHRIVVLGEESWTSNTVPSGLAFVVDPLDGTTNFLHGLPNYAVSIAAVHDGVPLAAVVLDATRNETFTAIAGKGAWLNDEPIEVSAISQPARALIGTGFPFSANADLERYSRQFIPVAAATAGIRRCGSAAIDLSWIACGRLDAFWELSIKPWDIAAGILLIAEAGGTVTGIDGAPATVFSSPIVAGNLRMHSWLLDALQTADRSAA